MLSIEEGRRLAEDHDARDALGPMREAFLFPGGPDGAPLVYLTGNSLGLQPRTARARVEEVLDDWARRGVEGHVQGDWPWLPYHRLLTAPTARLVGALTEEVVVMNTLTVNLHLLMVSFYRPTAGRHRILYEGSAFPSDLYALASQVRFHGYDPAEALVPLAPRPGEDVLRPEEVLEAIAREGERLALVLIGNVNYLTGQAFDVGAVTRAGHAVGAAVGFDLAHGAGNLVFHLHDDGPDFAVWCSYKYLNGGPGALGGVFVHARHREGKGLPRFEGWWGNDEATRFEMGPRFQGMPGAEGWQLSNPPILQMAALRASMELFDAVGMTALRRKSERLTALMDQLVRGMPGVEVITPADPAQRGAQLSLRIRHDPRGLVQQLAAAGVVCDFRAPDILRAAPAPFYTRFADVVRFAGVLQGHVQGG
ncbi:MAG TPA: kynureninase [Myxococcaceae bacterium]|nr:kynureninase [Myxococcaceae bacterium]